MRSIWLIARTVLIEAIRRREVYAIVLVSVLLIGAVMTVDFFHVEGLTKFYREVALQVMSAATALTVLVLAARQLPREFEARTIYPMLAKPVPRWMYLLGKLAGVMLAAGFCFGLFMGVYVAGSLYLRSAIPWALLGQYIYLQMVMLVVVATLSFWLSMVFNLDAAITLGVVFVAASATLTAAASFLYEYVGGPGKVALRAITFLLPQLTLFDLSGKTIHAEAWPPLDASTMLQLTAYGLVFAMTYFGLAWFSFRRRAL